MSNIVRISFGVTILGLILAVCVVIFTAPHWWYSVGRANAVFADGSSGTVEVYKARNSELLFSTRDGTYIYYPSTNLIGIPNGNQFIFVPFFVYNKDIPVPVVFSNNKVKVETDMNVVVENGTLQFTTLRGSRVEVRLGNFE